MERIKKKLHSQSGVSFLLALLAFLVAAMVSVTIVSAAVTAVKRGSSDREAQQAQLTLISAAQLVRDEMEKTKYVVTTVTSSPSQAGDGVTRTKTGTFGAEMQDAVEFVNWTGNTDEQYELRESFKIKATNENGFEMAPVDVSFVMKAGEEKYCLVFTFSMAETGEKLFLKMTGQKDTAHSPPKDIMDETGNHVIGTQSTVIETYTWINGIIDGIGDINE